MGQDLDPQPAEQPGKSDLRLFTQKVAIVAGGVVLLALLWSVRHILVLLFIAAVLAAGIAPVIRRVRTLFRLYLRRRISRGAAVVIVYLPFVVAALSVGFFVVPRVVEESRELVTTLPAVLEEKVLKPLEDYLPTEEIKQTILRSLEENSIPVIGYIRGAATVVVSVVIVFFLIFYMLIDAERLRNLFLLLYPASSRARMRSVVTRVAKRMSFWLSAQLVLASIIGIATFIALVSLRIPYAFPLALIAAIGEMVPVIGPIIGAIPALTVAIFQSTWQFWAVLAVSILIQQVENYLLVPRILGSKVMVAPLAVFIAFMIGGSLLGIVGAIMAIPVAAIAQVAFEEVFVARRERRRPGLRPGTFTKAPH